MTLPSSGTTWLAALQAGDAAAAEPLWQGYLRTVERRWQRIRQFCEPVLDAPA